MIKVHHLNCTTFNLRFARLFDGHGKIFDGGLSCVTHCLLVETASAGLVLIDTGFSIQDANNPKRVPPIFHFAFRPPWKSEETVLASIKALGFSPEEVHHILLTHLDIDHASGLVDFPWAKAHVYSEELQSALSGKSIKDRLRYNRIRIKNHEHWEGHDHMVGDTWYGLKKVHPIKELGNDFAFVPLAGHSAGHGGIAIHTDDEWMLHAGDAYMMHTELRPLPDGPSNTGLFQSFIADNQRVYASYYVLFCG